MKGKPKRYAEIQIGFAKNIGRKSYL